MINVFVNFAFDFELCTILLSSNAKQIFQSSWSWANEKELSKQADILTFWLIGKSHSLYAWLIMFIFLQTKPGIQIYRTQNIWYSIMLLSFLLLSCKYDFAEFFTRKPSRIMLDTWNSTQIKGSIYSLEKLLYITITRSPHISWCNLFQTTNFR